MTICYNHEGSLCVLITVIIFPTVCCCVKFLLTTAGQRGEDVGHLCAYLLFICLSVFIALVL